MTEPVRNMLGFMMAPAAIGVVGIVWLRSARKWRPPFWLILGLPGGLAALGFVFFWFAGLLEFPCAYVFTILRMPGAVSVTGASVSSIVRGSFGHWVTNDYFAGLCGNHDNLTVMHLETPFNSTDYYFAYECRTRVVVPMTDSAAEMFPALMPPGDKLVGVEELNGHTNSYRSMGDSEMKLPAQWFRSVTHPPP